MPVPASTGQLRARVQDMQIGDYIVWGSDGTNYYFSDQPFGTERPILGASSSNMPYGNTYWYAIKVAKGLLIADRVIEHSVSWDTLNSSKRIEGKLINTADNTTGIIRSLTGGIAYADKNGNKSLTDQGYGAWPTNNEWDKYIANFPSNLIQSRKTLDDVFHWNGIWTWTQDTPILQLSSSGKRILRGKDSQFGWGWSPSSSTEYQSYKFGFRPCFEYQE